MALPYIPSKRTVTLISGAKGSGKSTFVGHLIRLLLEMYSEYYSGNGYDSVKFMPFAAPLYEDLSNFLLRVDDQYSDFHYDYIAEDPAFYPYAYEKHIVEDYLKYKKETKESLIYTTTSQSISYRQYLQQLSDWYKEQFGTSIFVELLLSKLKNLSTDEDHIIIDDARYLLEAHEVEKLCRELKIPFYLIHIDTDKPSTDTHNSEANYGKLQNVSDLVFYNKTYKDVDSVTQAVYTILRPQTNHNVNNLQQVISTLDNTDVKYVLENLIVPYLDFLNETN